MGLLPVEWGGGGRPVRLLLPLRRNRREGREKNEKLKVAKKREPTSQLRVGSSFFFLLLLFFFSLSLSLIESFFLSSSSSFLPHTTTFFLPFLLFAPLARREWPQKWREKAPNSFSALRKEDCLTNRKPIVLCVFYFFFSTRKKKVDFLCSQRIISSLFLKLLIGAFLRGHKLVTGHNSDSTTRFPTLATFPTNAVRSDRIRAHCRRIAMEAEVEELSHFPILPSNFSTFQLTPVAFLLLYDYWPTNLL